MPAITVTVRRVGRQIHASRGKVGYELGASLADVRAWMRANLPDLTPEQEMALALRELVRSDAALADLDGLVNRTVDVTLVSARERA